VPEGDINALRQAIAEALGVDNREYHSLSKAAHKLVNSKYNDVLIAKRLHNFYSDTIRLPFPLINEDESMESLHAKTPSMFLD